MYEPTPTRTRTHAIGECCQLRLRFLAFVLFPTASISPMAIDLLFIPNIISFKPAGLS